MPSPKQLSLLKIGTRGSALALAQADLFEAAVQAACPGLEIRRVIVKTTGDKRQDVRLAELSGASGTPVDKGIFTKELEMALSRGRIDVAVHSLKDVPTEIAPEFSLAGAMERAPVEDVLLSRDGLAGGVRGLPRGAVVATSSVRRKCQLLAQRPDLEVVEIRGNVPTRMRKLIDQPGLDAILLARAGLERLGWQPDSGAVRVDGSTLHAFVLPEAEMRPAAGQGAIGLEIRSGDTRAAAVVAAITHAPTWARVRCEREFLRLLQAGCHTPVGVTTSITGAELHALGIVFGENDFSVRNSEARGRSEEPERVAAELFAALG